MIAPPFSYNVEQEPQELATEDEKCAASDRSLFVDRRRYNVGSQ